MRKQDGFSRPAFLLFVNNLRPFIIGEATYYSVVTDEPAKLVTLQNGSASVGIYNVIRIVLDV